MHRPVHVVGNRATVAVVSELASSNPVSTPRFVLPPPPGPEPGYLRAAVVQLDYQASALCQAIHLLEQPPMHEKDPGWPNWFGIPSSANFTNLHKLQKDIGSEMRKLYSQYLQQRIVEILKTCKSWGVNLVVFPEYSIPPECLQSILPFTGGMMAVLGTHAVEPKRIRSGTYTTLCNTPPDAGTSVAVFANDGRLQAFQAKLNKTHLEPDLTLAKHWHPFEITLPNLLPDSPRSLNLAVLICIDFLHRDSSSYRDYVSPKINNCQLVAVPSLTSHDTTKKFLNNASEEGASYKRPVLYANIAAEGNSLILVDSGKDRDFVNFPYGISPLHKHEEGVIIADIDCVFDSTKEKASRPYVVRQATVPVAASLLRYTTIQEDERASNDLAAVFAGCDLASCDDLCNAISTNIPRLQDIAQRSSETLQQRLTFLTTNYENMSRAEDVLRLLRDLELPPGVYSMKHVDDLRVQVALQMAEDYVPSGVHEPEQVAKLRRRLSELHSEIRS